MTHVAKCADVQQTMFCGRKMNDKQEVKDGTCYRVISKPVVRKLDSFLFKTRIQRQYEVLLKELDPGTVDVVHAHFLFTDGALALRLKKVFDIPYVVTVRNTDVNIYFKYFPHLHKLAERIIAAAEKVIFIAPTHQGKIMNYLSPAAKIALKNKVDVVPNGINSFWIQNLAQPKQRVSSEKVNFLYVGTLNKNKNVSRLVSILSDAQKHNGVEITLSVIGPPAEDYASFLRLSQKNSWVKYLGEINEQEELQHHYRAADFFIMLSSRETFGLVYIEAMTQGTPVIFTKGQGIDGYFVEKTVGIPFDLKKDNGASMIDAIKPLKENYASISANCVEAAGRFSWIEFGAYYAKLYVSIFESTC